MHPSRRIYSCIFLLFLVLSGCSSAELLPRQRKAKAIADTSGWSYQSIAAKQFDLIAAASPRGDGTGQLTIYVEGDGLAFLGPRTISSDPTPDDPTALRLALGHPGGSAAYLARPCQYQMAGGGRNCHPSYWTSHRYAPEVIESMGQVVDVLKERAGAQRLVLVGYSGGGAIAVLLAARRSDVVGIVTVAANLDLRYWTTTEKLAPLSGSLDPADAAHDVEAIPQVHFVGRSDDVVAPEVVRSYISHMVDSSKARVIEVPGFSHVCCWAGKWADLSGRSELRIIPGWAMPAGNAR